MKKSNLIILLCCAGALSVTAASLIINGVSGKKSSGSSSSSSEILDNGVYFICNGGKIKYSDFDSSYIDAYVAYGGIERIDLGSFDYTPYRENYTFEGWYSDPSLEEEYKVDGIIPVEKKVLKLYAHYEEEDRPGVYDYTCSENNKYITLHGIKNYDSSVPYNLKMPSYIGGVSVQYIDNNNGDNPGFNVQNIFSLVLPDSVYYIYSNVFTSVSIETLKIPDSLSYIGYEAFAECKNLKEVTFGASPSIKTIANKAFYHDEALEKIALPDSLTTLSDQLFEGCTSLSEITIPDSVTSIGNDIIKDTKYYNDQKDKGEKYITIGDTILYEYLGEETEIVIPKEATYLGPELFNGRSSLTKVTFEENSSCKVIGKCCFEGCTSINEEIVLPASVTTINSTAFAGDTCAVDASKCNFANNSLTSSSFESYGGTSVKLPSSLTRISSYAFRNATNLVNIHLADSVNAIETSAFEGCTSLKDINMPSSLIYIYSSAFKNCSSLEEVILPDTLNYIYAKAFSSCSSLKSVTLPSSLKTLGDSAFASSSNIASLVIPSTLTKIGNRVFEGWKSSSTITFSSMSKDEVIAVNTPVTETIDGNEVSVDYTYGCEANIIYK